MQSISNSITYLSTFSNAYQSSEMKMYQIISLVYCMYQAIGFLRFDFLLILTLLDISGFFLSNDLHVKKIRPWMLAKHT